MCVYEPPEYPPRGGSSAVDVLGGRRSSQACRQHPSCESASRVTAEEYCRMAADTARAHRRTGHGVRSLSLAPLGLPSRASHKAAVEVLGGAVGSSGFIWGKTCV